jgi:hypothetical protein
MNSTIYHIDPVTDKLEVYLDLPGRHWPNGIDLTSDDQYLYVALYADPKDHFARIHRTTKKMEVIQLPDHWPAGADGLYFYRQSLIAILPGPGSDRIVRYFLDKSGLKADRMEVLVDNDPLLSQPTTGVIVANKLYYVATSNLQIFARLYRQNNGRVDPAALSPVRIGVVSLE